MTNNIENSFRLKNDIDDVLDDESSITFRGVPTENNITFNVEGQEVLKFSPGGDMYVQGRLAVNDSEIVDGMRRFLRGQGLI